MIKHTFIFEEGLWKARGKYYDENNNSYLLGAEAKTSHLEDEWIHEGVMIVKMPNVLKIQNEYEIVPLLPHHDFTNWVQFNPTIGIITGKFMIQGEVILSNYRSETGEYTGAEVLIQVNERKYLNKGFAFKGNKKLSSWDAELDKVS